MSAGAGIFVTFALLVALVPATVMVFVGRHLRRRSTTAGLVPIDAVVVAYTNWTTPKRVTFDYPAPDGTVLRATRVEGFSDVQRPTGWFVHPGARLTVYVNPARPHDVRLSQAASAAGFGGVALIAAGCVWALLGLSFAAVTASLLHG